MQLQNRSSDSSNSSSSDNSLFIRHTQPEVQNQQQAIEEGKATLVVKKYKSKLK